VAITVTFDIERPTPAELNRVRGGFERLGWQHLGNTACRFPELGQVTTVEDWFNRVIPALMLLRCFARSIAKSGRILRLFTIDVQSSTGYMPLTDTPGVGVPPLSGVDIEFVDPSKSGNAFGARNLRDWLDSIEWPY